MTDALTRAGELAIAEAERLWSLDVIDPRKGDTRGIAIESLVVINDIIRTAGWGFATPYRGNGEPQWCGMFAAKCWAAGGLDPSWFATYWASTYRLHLWARYRKFSTKSKTNPPPMLGVERRELVPLERGQPLGFEPRAGDIIIVGDGEPDEGDHVTLCVRYDAVARTFDTISGNGGGVGPKGNKREGISRRDYAIDASGHRAMWIIRPAVSDLLAEINAT